MAGWIRPVNERRSPHLESERKSVFYTAIGIATQTGWDFVGQLGKLRPIGNRLDPEGSPRVRGQPAAITNRRAGWQPAKSAGKRAYPLGRA